jgi:hypothetical protein
MVIFYASAQHQSRVYVLDRIVVVEDLNLSNVSVLPGYGHLVIAI